MRKVILLALFGVGLVSYVQSQTIISKTIGTSGKNAEMKFDFADDIHIEAWNKNTIELEVSVNLEDNKYNDYYSLNIDEEGDRIQLVEKVDFESIKKELGVKKLCNFETTINYKLKVPTDLAFDLKTISGEIELIGVQGEMNINSVSGFIDYSIPLSHKVHIDLSTVTGDVYSNVKFNNTAPKEFSWVGTKRELSLNEGTVPVEFKTVSGDIFLRKL